VSERKEFMLFNGELEIFHCDPLLLVEEKERFGVLDEHCFIGNFPKILSCVSVSIDGVWMGDTIYWPFIQPRLVTTLCRSLTRTDLCPQSIKISISSLLTTDFNTGIITLSLNYTFQISHTKSFLLRLTIKWAFLQLISYSKPIRHGPTENTALLLLCPCSLPQIYCRVYPGNATSN
jgi:hypothetical protein